MWFTDKTSLFTDSLNKGILIKRTHVCYSSVKYALLSWILSFYTDVYIIFLYTSTKVDTKPAIVFYTCTLARLHCVAQFCCISLSCHFQSKHQKHQAFEAELHANADRIRGVIDTGNALIQRGACAGSEDAVKV